MPEDKVPEEAMRRVVLALVEHCVRNTRLEDFHAGTVPDSLIGDYSDVKVVTPYGEIPWTEVSRISDAEMKALMIDIVNKVYTFLTHLEDVVVLRDSARWNRPEQDPSLLAFANRRAAAREAENEKKY
ncbi:hypothetical protein J2X47_000529 [Sphingomonas sp. BE270]|jgi:hypothetical protein|uniref:hypothetical protein n=1 Tax=Sphingomonas sp. BE270 TaxID=2817726 RepID=UPI0028580691|nr:hypothetical protein [Sphingomonas sp. BE270]MDR7256368.1 hypothetical protein [Sphingomonas sp. BE270]